MNKPIGTCGLCGGPVTIPDPWYGISPPTPSCERCGAIPVEPHGPVMPMKPRTPTFERGPGCVGVTNGPKQKS